MLQTLCAGRKHIPVRVKQPSEERSSPSHPPRLSWRRAVRGLALSARARGVSLQNAPPLQTGKICFFCVAGDTLGWGTRLARGRKGTRLTSGRAWCSHMLRACHTEKRHAARKIPQNTPTYNISEISTLSGIYSILDLNTELES